MPSSFLLSIRRFLSLTVGCTLYFTYISHAALAVNMRLRAMTNIDSAVAANPRNGGGIFVMAGRLVQQGIIYVNIIAVVALTYGAFVYITSYGEDAKVKKAKKIVTFSFVGVLVSIMSYGIINLVSLINVTSG
jgi:hypothetical protein